MIDKAGQDPSGGSVCFFARADGIAPERFNSLLAAHVAPKCKDLSSLLLEIF